MKKSILFCASNTTHITMFGYIIQALKKICPESNIKVISLNHYYGQIKLNISIPQHRELQVEDLPRQWAGEFYWKANIKVKIGIIVEGFFKIRYLIHKSHPEILILGNDIGILEKLLIQRCMLSRVPIILIQDGILSSSYHIANNKISNVFDYFLKRSGIPNNRIYGLSPIEIICVMGQYTYELLIQQGKKPEHIYLTGQPRFDEYFSKSKQPLSQKERNDLAHKYNVNGNQHIITFFSQAMISYNLMTASKWNNIISDVLKTSYKLKDQCETIIKLHPAENYQEFLEHNKVALDTNSNLHIYTGPEIIDLLQISDVIIIYSSTVGLEALIFNKPVIIYNPYNFEDNYQFVKMGAALLAKTELELFHLIQKLKNEPELQARMKTARNNALRYHLVELDGNSSNRIATLISSKIKYGIEP